MASRDWQELLRRASALRQAGRNGEAIAAYRDLLELRPDLAESWYNLGWLQRQERQFEEAVESYGQALARGVSGPEEVHLNRAVILTDHLHQPHAAQAELEAALRIAPAYTPALLNLGNLHEDRGEREAARTCYQAAREAERTNWLALARLAGVTDPVGPDDGMITALRLALHEPSLSADERADLGFALGRLLDNVGDYDEAFAAYAAANAASRCGRAGYDRKAHERFVDRLLAAFPAPEAPASEPSERIPLFICGMFRSGSTLIEQILAGHPQVAAGGELETIPELIARDLQPYPEAAAEAPEPLLAHLRDRYRRELARIAPESPVVTDKRPDNFLHVGLIKRLFPSAKIVHTRRHPLDNVLSLYFLQLNPGMSYALDLGDAAHWYREHDRLMEHWKSLYPDDIFTVDYDALVADPEPVVQELLRFVGLDWDPRCLEFDKRHSVVKTASVWQVRQPLHARSSGRRRHYAQHLGEARAILKGRVD